MVSVMSDHSWLICQKVDVQAVKSFLNARNQLYKGDKVRPWNQDLMAIPCTANDDEEPLLLAFNNIKIDHSVLKIVQHDDLALPTTKNMTLSDTIETWYKSLSFASRTANIQYLLTNAPKRWSTYHPMILLPAGSFQDPNWMSLLTSLSTAEKQDLWTRILVLISKLEGRGSVTHLAINSGIPLNENETSSDENVFRSPSGLIMLHGDFGPALSPTHKPTEADFEEAFWVSSKQNGIWQTWAPRYTMFSRGNIKEKARILQFHDSTSASTPTRKLNMNNRTAAVDLYAGIGYFVFSYATSGFGRIWCWEINSWSVEGLRRGALKNKWSIQVVKGATLLDSFDLKDDILPDVRIVVFEEGNENAQKRMGWHIPQVDTSQVIDSISITGIKHVNCGFLPSSEPSWRTAISAIQVEEKAWLHLHENVAYSDIETRKSSIQTLLRSWAPKKRHVVVEHVELVKSFAPGIWHCVFDVYISIMTNNRE